MKELDGHLKTDESDARLAWVASIFLDGTFRVVGEGVFERRKYNTRVGECPQSEKGENNGS